MDKLKIEVKELIFFGIIFLGAVTLSVLKVFNGEQITFVIISLIAYFLIKILVSEYLNFIIQIRNSNLFPDNRTASFLTFDFLKTILIIIALLVILILGVNKILNNETIATLLGGLVGSLLTLRGSYTDIKLNKNQKEEINKLTNNSQNN